MSPNCHSSSGGEYLSPDCWDVTGAQSEKASAKKSSGSIINGFNRSSHCRSLLKETADTLWRRPGSEICLWGPGRRRHSDFIEISRRRNFSFQRHQIESRYRKSDQQHRLNTEWLRKVNIQVSFRRREEDSDWRITVHTCWIFNEFCLAALGGMQRTW